MPLTRVYHAQKPSFWQRQHANLAYCREPNLFFAFLPRRESLLSKQDGQNLLPQFRKIICLVGAPLAQAEYCSSPRQRQHANLACCREPNLIFALLTAQRIFAIKTRRTKPPAAISQDYLLGESWAGHPHPMYYGCGRFLLIRSVLIYAMCLFEDGIGVARRRP